MIHSLDTADNDDKIKKKKGVQTSQVFTETVTFLVRSSWSVLYSATMYDKNHKMWPDFGKLILMSHMKYKEIHTFMCKHLCTYFNISQNFAVIQVTDLWF